MATTVAQEQEDLIGGLVEALLAEGFTGYCCGPKKDPHAMIAVYEWRDHVDMITMHREGHAVAVRLANPGGVRIPDGEPNPLVLNPPDTVEWAWGGPMDTAIWQLLDLPHPEHPDAPAAKIPTPEALRVPRESQRPLHIRVPDPARVDAHAARLRERPPKILSPEYFNDLLEYVDRESAIAFASHFVPNGKFTWGNFPTLTGRTAITEFTQGFFAKISAVEHDPDPKGYHLWGEDLYVATTGRVTFIKLDGSKVTVPYSTGSHFNPEGDGTKMDDYTVYLDPSPLVGVTVPA